MISIQIPPGTVHHVKAIKVDTTHLSVLGHFNVEFLISFRSNLPSLRHLLGPPSAFRDVEGIQYIDHRMFSNVSGVRFTPPTTLTIQVSNGVSFTWNIHQNAPKKFKLVIESTLRKTDPRNW
jgi:hypothetical protein